MNNNKRVPYYLYLNDMQIIDLTKIGLEGFTDYLNLCIFTGHFKNFEELEKALKKFGYLNESENITNLSIIKQKGNKNNGYKIVNVSNKIVFRRELYLMDGQTLHDFFDINKYNFDVMYHFFSDFKKNLIERKAMLIKNRSIDSRLDYLIVLVNQILPIIKKLREIKKEYGSVNSQLIPPYYDGWIDEFIDMEIYFKKSSISSFNVYGLINLACRVSNLLNINGIKKPIRTKIYDKSLEMIERKLKQNIMNMPKSEKIEYVEDFDEDPDQYVFLDNSDFEGLYPNNEIYKEILEIQIDNLEAKKRKL